MAGPRDDIHSDQDLLEAAEFYLVRDETTTDEVLASIACSLLVLARKAQSLDAEIIPFLSGLRLNEELRSLHDDGP